MKFGDEFRGTLTRERLRWRSPAGTVNYRSVLSSERGPIITNMRLSEENFKEREKKKAGYGSKMAAGHQNRLAD
jgi:hypothetical protein